MGIKNRQLKRGGLGAAEGPQWGFRGQRPRWGSGGEAPWSWSWSFLTKIRRKNCIRQPCIFQFCQFLTWCKTITFLFERTVLFWGADIFFSQRKSADPRPIPMPGITIPWPLCTSFGCSNRSLPPPPYKKKDLVSTFSYFDITFGILSNGDHLSQNLTKALNRSRDKNWVRGSARLIQTLTDCSGKSLTV